MSRRRLGESVVEEAAIEYFTGAGPALAGLGYTYAHGPDLDAERGGPAGVVLEARFRAALARINPHLPPDALDDVARQVLRPESPSTAEANLAFVRMVRNGVPVEVRRGGAVRGDLARLVDLDDPDANDWLVANQFTVVEETTARNERRPDLVVFLNGLPVAVFELKDPTDERATLDKAYNQLQTYKAQVPSLFNTNGVLVISDGTAARVGSLTAPLERFAPWRTDADGERAPDAVPELQTVVEGLFEKRALLDHLAHFGFWEQDPDSGALVKKTAAYHQVRATNEAVESVVEAAAAGGDRRGGVVWHTTGSGKSVTMAFFAGKAVRHPALENPTLVFLTDRNDLDDQLFRQFAAARDLMPAPVQAEDRDDLRRRLAVASGGVVFTTIQKFGTAQGERMPELTGRRNVVVVADEAHRSHYEFVDGLARNLRDALPNATFVGFTGTPLELSDKSTPEVFGGYVDTYTISEAIEDGATVPIFYEGRLAALDLPEDELARLDAGFEELTEDEEDTERTKAQGAWRRVEAVVGLKKRLKAVAADLLDHYDRRTEILEGKGLVVAMSRRIAADLYREVVRLRPEWHSDDDEAGQVKVVVTGDATDDADLVRHVRNKARRRVIERRFKEPVEKALADGRDPLRLVIVRDMWLTGFDVPSAHTLYVDKPMRGHGLIQAISRVNRRFEDKPAGLVVDYIGIADSLRDAVGTYGGRRDRPALPVSEALAALHTALDVVRALFHGFDVDAAVGGTNATRLAALGSAVDHVLGLPSATDERGGAVDGPDRFRDAMGRLNKAAAVAVHLDGARGLRDEIGFYQQVQRALKKPAVGARRSSGALDLAIKQLVSGAVQTGGVVDLFEVAGVDRPNLSVLSDEFLERVRAVPQQNLQVELLRRLVKDQVRSQTRRNVVQEARFSDMLADTLNKYRNRSLETAQIVAELIAMAKEIRDAPKRADALGLTDDELAFYDALTDPGGVEDVLGDDVLGAIARDLAAEVRRSATIDWRRKADVRAKMRARVKRLLRRHGYPPDKAEGAVETVIAQAEAFGRGGAAE